MKKISPFLILFFLFLSPSKAQAFNIQWFDDFQDPNLKKYVLMAIEQNKDVEIARKNILKYRQEKNLSLSKLFPELNVGANYALLKIPASSIPNTDIQPNSFILPFNFNWELDYLLKNYNRVEKAKLDIENSILELESTRLITATDTASAYFNVSNLNKQIEEGEKILTYNKKIYEAYKKMLKIGTVNIVEVNLKEENFLNSLNNLNNLKKQRGVFLTNLAYLTGNSPYNLDEMEITPIDKIIFKGNYPENLSGSVICNRPDIKKLENEIKKAKIDITIAKKDFLPKITVIGVMSFSTIVQNFGWDGVFAALLAGATQNIFDGGKRIFNFKLSKVEYETKIENYLKADLNALKEVNESLYTLKKDKESLLNGEKMVLLAKNNFIKAHREYNFGKKSYLYYLDENNTFINSNMNYYNLKNQNFINLISLYKAVGGAL